MKTFLLFISVITIWFTSFSQIGGLSASKLGTLSTETVSVNKIEFEPFFGFSYACCHFNENRSETPLFASNDSLQIFSDLGLRFTYGVINNLEIGISLPIDVSTISFGAKYKLPIEGNHTFGILAGYNTLLGNNIFVRKNSINETTPAFVGGMIMSSKFSDKFSIDFMAQYQMHTILTANSHKNGYFISADAGYYLLKEIDFIIGMYYYFIDSENNSNSKSLFTINPGITIERAENFILVLNTPFDIFGKNEYKTTGFSLALTILLD